MRRIIPLILLLFPIVLNAQDLCSNASSLCANNTIIGASTASATASGTDPALACGDLTVNNSVWFTVLGVSAGSATVTITNINNNPGLAMQVYTGTCGSLVPVGPCNSANGPGGSMSIIFATAAGTTYYVMVDGESGNQESFDITVTSASNSVVARPDANFIANPTSGCSPMNVFLDNTTVLYGGTNITYQWRVLPGPYINSTGADTTMVFTSLGTYQIELRVCNTECGCKSVLQEVVVQNLVPTIGFSPSGSCLNMPISFTGNATVEPSPPVVNPNVTSWLWNFGDPNSGVNNTASGQNVVHTFVGPGSSFTVRLVTDGTCGPDTVNTIVTLNPRVRVNAGSAQTICQGNPVTLSATPINATGSVSYTWSGNPTITCPACSSTTVTGLAPGGPYVYNIHISDANNCTADTTVNVTMRVKPIVSAGPDDTLCMNTATALSGSVIAGQQPLTYTWSPAAGLSSTSILTPTATISSTRTYCLSAIDTFGCRADSDCVTLNVYPRPTVSASLATLCTSMNPPLQTTITVNGAGAGSTYSWKLSAAYSRISSSNADSSVVTATFPVSVATYSFTVIVFNPTTGCRDTLTTVVQVTAGINITVSANRTICQGASTNLTAAGATSFLWSAIPAYAFADPALANQTVSPNVTTTFIVRGTTGTCYEEDTVVVTVRPKPIINAGPDDTVCVNTPYVLQGSVIAGLQPLIYSWSPSTGLSSTTVLNPTTTISTGRTYCLAARDTFGCLSDTDCVTLSVYPLPAVSASPSTLCASLNPPLQSVFTVSGAGAGSTYRWRLSANYSLITSSNADSSVVTATFPPGVATTYSFRVVVFNPSTSCSDTLNLSFTVTAGLSMTTSANRSICAGASTTLSASGATTYLWSANPAYPFADATMATQTVSPSATTTFIVRGTTGNCYDEDTVVVTVRPKPIISAGPEDTVCVNTPYVLQGSVIAGLPPLIYSWSPSGGLNSTTILNPNATISSQRTYCLVARDTFNCVSDTDCVTLSVYPQPAVSASPATLCASLNPPLQSVFTVSGAGAGSTYRWRLSANYSLITSSNADSSVVTATFPPGVATTYSFRVVVFNPSTSCSDTLNLSFTVTAGLNMTTTTNRTICAGGSTNLSASGATTYLWTANPAYPFADATQAAQAVSPTITTTFIVRGTTGSCYDEDTVIVTVRPKPVVNAGPDDTLCVNTPYVLQGSVIAGLQPLTYSWFPLTGLNNATLLNPTATISSTRTYCLTAIDTFGCTADSDCVTLNVYPQPTISASPSTLCASQNPPLQTTFTVNGAGAGSTYSWKLSPNYTLITSSNADSSVVTATFPTGVVATYNFRVVVFNPVTGCSDTINTSFSVTSGLSMAISPSRQLCFGDTALLTANGATTYLWTASPAYTFLDASNDSQLVSPTVTTTFYVTGTTGNCSDVDTIVITIRPKPVVNAGSDDTVCTGVPIPLQATITAGIGPFTQLWNPATGLSSATSLNPTATISGTTTYCITVTDSLGCQSDSDCVTLYAYPLPVVDASPSSLCASQAPPFQTTFTVTGAAGGSSYSWILSPDYALITSSSVDSSSVTAVFPTGIVGVYSFTVVVQDAVTGCSDTLLKFFNVTPGIDMTVSPDTQICYGSSVTLTASGTTTYAWSSSPAYPFADSTLASQTVTLTANTIFYPVGTIGTCSDIDTIVVTMIPLPIVNIAPIPQFCLCDTVDLNGTGSTPGLTYSWTNTGGSVIINPTLVNAMAVVCSNDTFTLTVTDTNTTCASSASVTASPHLPPAASASVSPSPICDGVISVINLDGAGSNTDAGTSYHWTSIPATAITDDTLISTTANASTQTVYYLTVTDSLGCDSTSSDTVQIFPVPVISASPPYLCTNDPVLQSTISITGTGAGSLFTWDSIPACVTPATATGSSQLFDFATCGIGTFNFVVTVVDGVSGCVKTVSQVVQIDSAVTLTVTSDQSICEGDSVMLIASGANSFVWSPGGTTNDTLVVGDTLVASATPYVYVVTGTVGSCIGTDSVHVTVYPRPSLSPISGPLSVCENDTGIVYSVTSQLGVFYIWSITGGTISSGLGTESITVSWGSAGPGTVTLNDTNAFGCSGNPRTINVTINPLPPDPVISGTDTLCQNSIATYSVTPVVGVQYNWIVTNGTVLSPVNTDSISVQWTNAGTGSVIIQLVNGANCPSLPDTFDVTIKPIPLPNPVNGNSSLCEGDTAQIYSVTDNPGAIYQWVVNGGALVSGQGTDSISVNWGTAGLGLVQMIESGSNGCTGDTNSLNIFLNLAPIADASPDTIGICRNTTAQPVGAVNIGTVRWFTSGTGTFDDTTLLSPVYTPGATDSGYINLGMIASNPPCADDTDIVVLYISPAPVAAIASASGGSLCAGSTDTLTASGGTTYSWQPTNDTTATIYVSPTTATDYTVIVGNVYGCFDTASIHIDVLPHGVPTGGIDQWICIGDSVYLIGSVINAGGVIWSTTGDGQFFPNNVLMSTAYIPGPNDTANQSVNIIITSQGACFNESDTVHVTITPVPGVFAGNDTTLSTNASLPLNGIATNSSGSLWTSTGTGNFVPSPLMLNATYEPSIDDYDLDSIIIHLINIGACRIIMDSFVVRFSNFQIPNVFTPYPNSPGYNDYFVITGLPSGSALKIWDRWGLLVFETDNYRNDWDAAELRSDSYYYILILPDKEYHGWIKVIRE